MLGQHAGQGFDSGAMPRDAGRLALRAQLAPQRRDSGCATVPPWITRRAVVLRKIAAVAVLLSLALPVSGGWAQAADYRCVVESKTVLSYATHGRSLASLVRSWA